MPVRKRAVPDDNDTQDTPPPGSPPLPPATTSHKRARVAPNGHSRTRTDPNDGSDDDGGGGGNRDHDDVDIQDETIEERAKKDRQFEEANYDKIMASVKSREKYSGVRRFSVV